MKRAAILVASALLVSACLNQQAPLVASDISIARPMPGMQMTAAYMTLTNNTTQQISISEITSPEFGSVQMHETVIEDGIASMRRLREVSIAAGGSVVFEPGAKHLMLMQLQGNPEHVTLEFHASDAVLLSVNVAFAD